MPSKVFQLVKKDLLLEFRQQHTLYGMLLYVASTIFVLYLSVNEMESNVWNGLFWVIQLFVCVNAVAKSFLQESRGRMLYYYSITGPVQFVLSKIIYNVLIMLVMSVLSLFLFYLFFNNPVTQAGKFLLIVLLGGGSISLVFTLMSAIAAKAQQNAALMAILGFPVILPLLILLMRLSKSAFNEIFREGAVMQLSLLIIGLDVLIIMLSIILFPYLWKD
jgi:heme exporter protein B